jgi:hypothetical protein
MKGKRARALRRAAREEFNRLHRVVATYQDERKYVVDRKGTIYNDLGALRALYQKVKKIKVPKKRDA